MEKYSVIFSAYECSPDYGSEAEMGWNQVMVTNEFLYDILAIMHTLEMYVILVQN